MNKQQQQNLIAIGIFFIAAVYLYHNYLFSPLKKKYKEASNKLQQTEAKLDEMKCRALELPKLQAEMKVLEKAVSELEKCLPKEKDIPELIRIVTKTAKRFQLNISNFAPGGITERNNYNEVPFKIVLEGQFHSLAHFLSELGQEPRILSVKNILLRSNKSSKDNESTINANFDLIAYTFKE